MKSIKNIVISLFIALVLVGGIFFLARSNGVSGTNGSALVSGGDISALIADDYYYDFGSISMAKGRVSHAFSLKNTGTKPVVIAKVYTSCMCTSANLTTSEGEIGPFGMPGHGLLPTINRVIAPGEEASVKVVFDPAAHGPAGIGWVERVVYLESGGAKPLELRFSATVTP